MQLAAHEVHDLHELTMSCVNSITNMALFVKQAQDPELKKMIARHFPYHVKDYNTKIEYLSKSGAKTGLSVPELKESLQNFTQAEVETQPLTPRTELSEFNDREIATAYLLTLKRAGREYAWAAMEASNPEIRCFLEDAFKMCSHHAFDIWQWMVKKGYYPLEAADPKVAGAYSNIYYEVPEEHHTIM
ncbi:MAG: spore coat protein [Desulfitobacteriia bacterium]|jgi:spore coat protein CotF